MLAIIPAGIFLSILIRPFIIINGKYALTPQLLRQYGQYTGAGSKVKYSLSIKIQLAHLQHHQLRSSMMPRTEGHFRSNDDLIRSISLYLVKVCTYRTEALYYYRLKIRFPLRVPVLLCYGIRSERQV